jgi:DNA-binding MarR family transcriptional regulator
MNRGKVTSPPGAPSEQAFRAFIRASALLRGVMRPYFSRHGLTGAQWGVLRSLYRARDEKKFSLPMADLGKRLLVRPPSLSGVVDRLQRAGLVSRRRGTTDQRIKEVSLTRAGEQLVVRVLRRHRTQVDLVMGGLSASETAALHGLLERLSERLAELTDENGDQEPEE